MKNYTTHGSDIFGERSESSTSSPINSAINGEIETAEAIYTGGGIWVYVGIVGGCHFMASDSDNNWVLLVDKDPNEEFDDAWYPEWMEEHGIEEFGDTRESFAFYDRLYDYLEKNNLCIDVKKLRESTNEYRHYLMNEGKL